MTIGNFVDDFPIKDGVKVGDLETIRDCDNALAYLTMRMTDLDPALAEMRQKFEVEGLSSARVDYSRVRTEHTQVRTAQRFVRDRRRAIASRESIELIVDETETKHSVAIARTIKDQSPQMFALWFERARSRFPEAFA